MHQARGCSGVGIGYAAANGCALRINRSVAVQFDVRHNMRVVRSVECRQRHSVSRECLEGAEVVSERLECARHVR